MKYAIIIPDGAADLPIDDLGGKTPLQCADIPNIDSVVERGRIGTTLNLPPNCPAGSDIAIMSVLGYNPGKFYTGRAPLEAAGRGISVSENEWVFRCNIVTIIDEIMEDHSAGHISTPEATAIIEAVSELLKDTEIKMYSGVAYRHLAVIPGKMAVKTTPPHDIIGKHISGYLPSGKGSEILLAMMKKAHDLLKNSDINSVKKDLNENPATDIWLWGQGQMPDLPAFEKQFHLSGAAITAVDLVRGISKLIGWHTIDVEGATGYVDTNYRGKGENAILALDNYDIVMVHIEGTDEAGHNADYAGKIHALEQIDKHIAGPVIQRLEREGEDWRILILPDHPTPCSVRSHTRDPVPFCIAGKRIKSTPETCFDEETAAGSDLDISDGSSLMEYFLTVR